jgi:nucleoside phosphorylase
MIVCAGNNETFSFAKPLGVGLIQSAINLTKLCLLDKPNEIVFIGSAGSYEEYNVFDIIESSSAANIELSFLSHDSYTPINTIIKRNHENFANDTLVNSSNYITTNETLSKKFKQHGVGIENMEFFSICAIAQDFNIPVAGIFIVTNHCNKNAHEDFKKNHHEAMKKLIRYLEARKLI